MQNSCMSWRANWIAAIRALFVFGFLSVMSGCALSPSAAPLAQADEPFLVHVVLVWLKEPGNQAHREQIIQASQQLRDIPGVLDLRVGEVVSSEREVVEDSYDVGLSLRFASAQDLQAYLTHPLHLNTVKQAFVPIMARYQVMDFAR